MKLTHPVVALWLWLRLRRAFPDALAVVIMPTHVHVFTPAKSVSAARCRLAAVVSALRRSKNLGAANTWARTYCEGVFDDPVKIARRIRYIVLNPCRDGLARCPLEWRWSTHRDLMGAVVDRWVTPERVARALGRPCHPGFAELHHAYVAGDPSTDVAGTPPPAPHDGDPQRFSIEQALGAAAASFRGEPDHVRKRGPVRRAFLGLAKRARWNATHLAEICEVHPQRIRSYLREDLPVEPATLLCLGDPRLTAHFRPLR